jgi:glycosyltransferase involved in cell wall biosynthesis
MSGIVRQGGVADPAFAAAPPFTRLVRKIVLLAADDVFLLSSCRSTIAVLREVAREVVVVTQSTGRMDEVEALGVRVIAFNWPALSRNLAQETLAAWRLARILEDDAPDAVHLFGFRPVALGALAAKLISPRHFVMHVPDLELLEAESGASARLYRKVALKLVAALAAKPMSFLLVENADDLTTLRTWGIVPGPRLAVLCGGGIDLDNYPILPPPVSEIPVAAYVGEFTRQSGLDLLLRAFDSLWSKGVQLRLELHGEQPNDRADAAFERWRLHPGISIHPAPADVRELWRRADILVLPSLRRGLPRALLEAAACARPLIVCDVPGGSRFVRNDVEGYLVPEGDAPALARALEQLARDSELRARMGKAARLRVLQGFTEAHVGETLRNAYRALLCADHARDLAGA